MFKKAKVVVFLGFLCIFLTLGISKMNVNAMINSASSSVSFESINYDFSMWDFNSTKVISTDIYGTSASPQVVVDEEFNVHVVWYDNANYNSEGTDWDIFYRRYDATTGLWEAVEVVSEGCSGDSSFPSIAVDNDLNVHVVWNDDSDLFGEEIDNDIFYRKFDDITSSWGSIQLVSSESTLGSYSMDIACDSLNQPHVVWYDYTDYTACGSDSDIFHKYWNATAGSWTSAEVVSTESTANSLFPKIAIDSLDQLHVVWEDSTDIGNCGTDKDVFYKYYSTSDESWSSVQIVTYESSSDSRSPSLTIDKLDVPHLAWFDGSALGYPGWDVCYKYYDFASYNWSSWELVSAMSTDSSWYPNIAIDSNGNKYITWYETSAIYYNRWDSTFSSWTTQKLISNPDTGSKEYPDLYVDSADSVHFVWQDYDQTYDSGSDWDIFYKLLSSPPEIPIISNILPNPSDQTSVYIVWNNVFRAEQYKLYRSDSFIWTTEGFTPYALISAFISTGNSYTDSITSEGVYYYVVVAENFAGESEISNCVFVEIRFSHVWEYGAISSAVVTVAALTAIIVSIYKKKKG